ncbi:MAG: menaquinone biosynthesis family protein [Phycisphaeraceae bacterium]
MTDTATQTDRLTLRIGHSPDPDDAFMWYPLANFTAPDGSVLRPKIDTGPYDFVHVLEDIQSLNERSDRAELEITALSIHQYPHVAANYALTSCGASLGDGYGPMVIAPQEKKLTLDALPSARLAIPGTRTSAWLALQLLLHEQGGRADDLDWQVVPFDQIIPKVTAGEFDAGLIIHEGQLTYADAGLDCVIDLGKWWTDTRGLPLPLGGNAIRRDLGEHLPRICDVLLRSIQWALAHREESVRFALNYARDMGSDLADEFVGMYVNQWTLDYGERGRAAVRRFLDEAKAAQLVPDFGEVDFVEPG